MKIAIVYHSKTNNTKLVAEMLKTEYQNLGHKVFIDSIMARDDDEMEPNNVILTNAPEIAGYDVVILAAPVRAFRLSAIMQAYINQLPSLSNMKIGVFVTQHFPFAWMGGNNAIRQFEKLLAEKRGLVSKKSVINWGNPKKRNILVDETLKQFADI